MPKMREEKILYIVSLTFLHAGIVFCDRIRRQSDEGGPDWGD
ncbi:hypothetical protein KTT_50550 [Tengunoibacter tsumagoiensis]|uniref:Uncharacterized protein n=1 Tax=Tengunoibacter tsumagoiensis TaxID=2014871 RepID=A0A402A864_9CHLR|nr:hypothetical protein KTT_50550 [Tengunoibacter tsumagoiensis]